MERIILEKVSKKFKIGFKKKQSALARLVSAFSGKEPKKTIWALNDVSFSAQAGEIIGIIGENGSGKSTLLRIIAGIYGADSGTIKTSGKIISLIGLYDGLKERLTMKENIFLCCSLFGLRQNEIKKKTGPIIAFAELDDFTGTKIYQFSEGMKQRLAFSIAMHCDPEILLFDECFVVGDEEFKNKGIDKIKELARNGVAILLVGHALDMIKKYSHKIIWLHEGRILMVGNCEEIIKEYLKKFGGR